MAESNNYFDLLEARKNELGDKPFIIIDSTIISYAQFYKLAKARALQLMLKIPFTKVKRSVLVLSNNFVSQAAAFIGLQGADIIPVLLHNSLSKTDRENILFANGINAFWNIHEGSNELIINDKLLADTVEASDTDASDNTAEVSDTDAGDNTADISNSDNAGSNAANKDEYSTADARTKPENNAMDLGVIPAQNSIGSYIRQESDVVGVLSSGTTGVPKVMYRTYHSWAGFFDVQNKIFGVNANTRMFMHGSLSFTGNLNLLLSVLYAGGTIITTSRMSAKSWSTQIRAMQANSLYMIPSKLQLLASGLNKATKACLMGEMAYRDGLPNHLAVLNSVEHIITGSQLLSRKNITDLKAIMPNASIVLYYGASELNYITYTNCDDQKHDQDNLGRPFPGVEISIDSASGQILVTNDYHISGITVPYCIKDIGRLNSRGELIFGGRQGDWINKGGYKINTTNIANKLKDIDGIMDAIVMPYEDKLRGSEIATFITPDKSYFYEFKASFDNMLGISGTEDNFELRIIYMKIEKQLRHAIRATLPAVEVPKKIILLGRIPLNDSGKADIQALEQLLKFYNYDL